ncbi:hypothetical protein BC332_34701 [Capsicum chinense]|nr:hypothetical protein BC332_34701 [Capsicum chinense]
MIVSCSPIRNLWRLIWSFLFLERLCLPMSFTSTALTNTWSTGMQVNVPRCLFGKESLGEIAIFACGCDSQGKILSSAELYNSETGTWRTLRSMNKTCKGTWTEIPNLSPVRPNLRNGIPATSAAPPLVAVVNNQFMLLTMLKCRLGSMKSITKNGFIELNSWYLVKDLKNGTCSAKSNQVALCITSSVMGCCRDGMWLVVL